MNQRRRVVSPTRGLVLVALLIACGSSKVRTGTGAPAASFVATPTSGPAPLTVSFDGSASADSDGSIVTWAWNFRDGATDGGATVSHVFAEPGIFDVTLTVTDDAGLTDTATRSITVLQPENEPPNVTLIASPSAGEIPLVVSFSSDGSYDIDGTIEATVWTFGDGATATTPQAGHTYTTAGSYDVTLTLTDDDGAAASSTVRITATDPANLPPSAAFVATPTSGDAPLNVALDASGSSDADGTVTEWTWSFGDGEIGTGETTSHIFQDPGSYDVVLTVTDDGFAEDSITATITVTSNGNQLPSASVTAAPESGTAPLTVAFDAGGSSDVDGTVASYAWAFGDGGSATGATPSHTYTEPGVYRATVTVTDDDGDTATASIEILVRADDTIIVDHTNVDLFDSIPAAYVTAAAGLRLFFCNRSVGGNVFDGMKCLGKDPEHPANIRGDSYDPMDPHFVPTSCRRPSYEEAGYYPNPRYRTAEEIDPEDTQTWFYEFWGEDGGAGQTGQWWERVSYFINTTERRIDQFDVISFQQSYLAVDEGSSIADASVGFFVDQVDRTDVADVERYQAAHPTKTVFLMTSSLARGIGTTVSESYNTQMRDYVASGPSDRIKVLLDVAAILSHTPDGTPCYDNRDGVSLDGVGEVIPDDGVDIPAICPEYTSEWNGGHLGSMSLGKIRVAKAFWVLMARIAGWDGT